MFGIPKAWVYIKCVFVLGRRGWDLLSVTGQAVLSKKQNEFKSQYNLLQTINYILLTYSFFFNRNVYISNQLYCNLGENWAATWALLQCCMDCKTKKKSQKHKKHKRRTRSNPAPKFSENLIYTPKQLRTIINCQSPSIVAWGSCCPLKSQHKHKSFQISKDLEQITPPLLS